MTTTEKTFQVPLTFKDNSTNLDKKPTATDDMPVIEDLEMSSPDLEPAQVIPESGHLSLPAALVDEELLRELTKIPDKMGFKIGDVADLLGIKAYVLRYWETEFEMLKPKKAANNQRYYTKKNVENAFLIRKLLHRDRFSIEGARAALRDLKSVVKKEVQKEKDWSQVTQKMNTFEERVDHLLIDLRQLKNLFV